MIGFFGYKKLIIIDVIFFKKEMNIIVETLSTFLSSFIYFIGLYIMTYKIELSKTSPYYIFPWSKHPIISNSQPGFLSSHIVFALALMTCFWLRIVLSFVKTESSFLKKILNILEKLSYALNLCFSVIVILGCKNLGPLDQSVAIIINLTILFVLKILEEKNCYHLYFYLLTLPIVFEFYLLASEFLRCILFKTFVVSSSDLICNFIPLHK
jgi:hypothetical protein